MVLKITISGGSLTYLVYLLGFEKVELLGQIKRFFSSHPISIPKVVLLIVLMFVNWGAEVYKWKLLLQDMFPVTSRLAIKSTLAGVATAVFTPYRIGGYFGKVALLSFRYRAKGIVYQVYNAMALFLVNFFFGLLFLGLLGLEAKQEIIGLAPDVFGMLALIGSVFIIIIAVLYVNVNSVTVLFGKMPFTNKWMKAWKVLEGKSYKKTALTVLSVSVIRYLVITYQYLLAFDIFGINADPLTIYFASGALFFLFQFVPVFNAVELGLTRTAMFTVILTTFGIVNEITPALTLAITTASFLIWVVNLAIPSIVGSLFLSQVKVLKEK